MRGTFETFVRSVRGGFLGLAVGDALGVPVELMTHEQIMALTDGKGVTDYIDPVICRVDDMRGAPIGSTSDDTQLARVTARSLTECGGFDLVHQAMSLVREYEITQHGWGGTTRAAAIEFKLWRDSAGQLGRNPEHPTPPSAKPGFGEGSGPAMKIFPLAAWGLFGDGAPDVESLFVSQAVNLGFMTHGDPRATIASVALGKAIGEFAREDDPDWHRFSKQDRAIALMVRQVSTILGTTRRAEASFDSARPTEERFSHRLGQAVERIYDPVRLRQDINKSFRAMDSVPFAILTAIRHPEDFRAGVQEAILGGHDADTTASMVGAMIGSRVGTAGIPREWLNGLRDAEAIVRDADRLCCAAFGVNPDDHAKHIPVWKLPA